MTNTLMMTLRSSFERDPFRAGHRHIFSLKNSLKSLTTCTLKFCVVWKTKRIIRKENYKKILRLFEKTGLFLGKKRKTERTKSINCCWKPRKCALLTLLLLSFSYINFSYSKCFLNSNYNFIQNKKTKTFEINLKLQTL